MKTRHIAAAIALACICWSMTGCVTSIAPDGTTSKTVDPMVYRAALVVLAEYQRQNQVIPDK